MGTVTIQLNAQPIPTVAELRLRLVQLADIDPLIQIILDIDDTDDEVHGGQQLSLFNGHYDEHCYMPLHIYEGRSGKPITTIICGCLPLYLYFQHQKITNSWMYLLKRP